MTQQTILKPETAPTLNPEPLNPEPRSYQTNPVIIAQPILCPRCKTPRPKGHILHAKEFPNRPVKKDGITYPGQIVQRSHCHHCGLRYIVQLPITPNTPPPPTDFTCAICHTLTHLAKLALIYNNSPICQKCANKKTSTPWLEIIKSTDHVTYPEPTE